MTTEQFVYWLQGFMQAIHKDETLSIEHMNLIRTYLGDVTMPKKPHLNYPKATKPDENIHLVKGL